MTLQTPLQTPLETPGGDLGFQGSILGHKPGRKSSLGAPFWDGFGMLLASVVEVLFWKASGPCWSRLFSIWDRVRHMLDTKREPAQNNEKLDFCCYLPYFRHVADPENDAISEHVHVFWVFFFKALFWGPHFCVFL